VDKTHYTTKKTRFKVGLMWIKLTTLQKNKVQGGLEAPNFHKIFKFSILRNG